MRKESKINKAFTALLEYMKSHESPQFVDDIMDALGYENKVSGSRSLYRICKDNPDYFKWDCIKGVKTITLIDSRTIEEKAMDMARAEMLPVQSAVRTGSKVIVASEADYESINTRIAELFEVAEWSFDDLLNVETENGLALSGAKGTGKSTLVKSKLKEAGIEPVLLERENLTDTILFKTFEANPNGVIVLDDCTNLTNLNVLRLLGMAVQKESIRVITHKTKSVEFSGKVIIITNYDLHKESQSDTAKGRNLAPVVSRCIPMDLGCHKTDEAFVRMMQLADKLDHGLSKSEFKEVCKWTFAHRNAEWKIVPDARTLEKICGFRKRRPTEWQKQATRTYLK